LWGAIYAVAVLALIAAAFYTLTVSVWRGPWRDTWEAMPFIQNALAGQASLADYWEQYGYSHRPLVSRWLWVADIRWFAGSNHLLLAVSLLMQSIIYFSVRAVLRRDTTFDAQQRCIVLVGVLFCLYNITQVFNFLHTFDVQWFVTAAGVILSLERILAGAPDKKTSALVLAWFGVFIGSLNNFSALVMWPVEVLLLVALRYRPSQILWFGLAIAAYLVLYFHDLPSASGDVKISQLFSRSTGDVVQAIAGVLVVFPLWYLSNPLSFQLSAEGPLHMPWPVSWCTPLAMALLLSCVAYSWMQGLLQRKQYSAVAWLGLSLALYGYGVGVVTALGRGLFWDNVYALRYQNIVLLFWMGMVLWFASSVQRRELGLFAGATMLLLVFTVNIGWNHDNILKIGNRTRDAHLALVVGLESQLSAIQATVSRSHLFEGSDYNLTQEAGYLRDRSAGPYADPAWFVPALAALENSATCKDTGAQYDVHGDDTRYARLSISFAQPVQYTLIAWFDEDTQHPGLLIATRADTWVARWQQTQTGFTDYAGFSKQLPQKKPLQVYASNGDSWCRLLF
jgi:hypothetical protein